MSREKTGNNSFTVIIIIISIMLIGGLVRNALSLYQDRGRLDLAKKQVDQLEIKKNELKKQIKIQTDTTALDQAIRNKLNLAKPGETIVVISGTDNSPKTTPTPTQAEPSPPIQQWWNLFNPK